MIFRFPVFWLGRIEGTLRGPAEQAWFSAPFCDRESVAAVRRELG
jgi:hypothetical protein